VPDAATPRASCAAALHLSLFSGAALARRNGTLPVIVAAAFSGAARMRIAAVVAELNKHPAATPFMSWTPFAPWLFAAVLFVAPATAAGYRVRAPR
jgi:hypothetical protein